MAKGTVQGRLNRETNPIPGEIPGFNPQFVDDEGYATDVTPSTPFPSGNYVQTDGGIWVPQKGSDDGAAHVQLTGSNVEEVVQRNIYKSGQSRTLSVPDHIKGVNIETRIHGVTGTNPNFSILAYAGRIKLANILLREENITNPVRINFIFYPGASRGDAETLLPNEIFKVAGIPAYPSLYLAVQINGSFEGDEGFDYEVNAAWLI